MRLFKTAIAAMLIAVGSAVAQTPAAPKPAVSAALPTVKGLDGRWEGVLQVSGVDLTLVFIVSTDAAGTHVKMQSPDQDPGDIPVSSLARDGDTAVFRVDAAQATYTAKLGSDGKSMKGSWSQGGQAWPLDLAQKAAGGVRAPVVSGLDGKWTGLLEAGGAQFHIVLNVVTSAATGTTATLQSPDQLPQMIPVQKLVRDGAKISFAVAAVAGTYQGELSADGKSITGAWTQLGADQPLNLSR